MTEREELAIKTILHKYSIPFIEKNSPQMKPEDLVGLSLEEAFELERQLQDDMRAFSNKGLDMIAIELHKLYKQ